jgi:hypothetical protein
MQHHYCYHQIAIGNLSSQLGMQLGQLLAERLGGCCLQSPEKLGSDPNSNVTIQKRQMRHLHLKLRENITQSQMFL